MENSCKMSTATSTPIMATRKALTSKSPTGTEHPTQTVLPIVGSHIHQRIDLVTRKPTTPIGEEHRLQRHYATIIDAKPLDFAIITRIALTIRTPTSHLFTHSRKLWNRTHCSSTRLTNVTRTTSIANLHLTQIYAHFHMHKISSLNIQDNLSQ